MQTSSILALVLATCGTAIAVPAASPSTPGAVKIASPIDCTALVDYCKCLDGNFDCETDPDCEWCRENVWDIPPSPSKK
ncbi:hypothetical protein F4821DRAFT_263520 [Hypoxylon rubiginosum]|uniref:Uncharacterized protein n=1 Tax=Hypoxylon rubiginosum TaxID=110542 RepID=A0ACC0CQX0_9PEZI|nr:hypothetical protein F4821DRAFT_263520 [Hypoxylon rubiginosum]